MKSNKLIAEFMGGIPSSVPNLINLPQTIGQSRILCVKGSEGLPNGTYEVKRINDLKYHSSWDWLMPVVEEIDHLQFEEVVEIETGLKMRSLSATYNAVVEFINQLNN